MKNGLNETPLYQLIQWVLLMMVVNLCRLDLAENFKVRLDMEFRGPNKRLAQPNIFKVLPMQMINLLQ
ncbi:MAG: hypothetical protein CL489_14655 [Acidobacteria bacterium]|nr:hypothetical protein [Acidobacteriota bacterium]